MRIACYKSLVSNCFTDHRFEEHARKLKLISDAFANYLGLFVLASADPAELAETTAPVLLVLLQGALTGFQAEPVERLAAHLTVQHLHDGTTNLLNNNVKK